MLTRPSRRVSANLETRGGGLEVWPPAHTRWEEAPRSRPLWTCSRLQRPRITSGVVARLTAACEECTQNDSSTGTAVGGGRGRAWARVFCSLPHVPAVSGEKQTETRNHPAAQHQPEHTPETPTQCGGKRALPGTFLSAPLPPAECSLLPCPLHVFFPVIFTTAR